MTVHERLTPYAPIEPFRTGMLDVGDGHTMYYEESGNPRGQPALLVHGGPGGGSNPTMRRFHDPRHYRIIAFDQRGCGRSTPHASLEANTTWHLVADMERLREALGIERWQVFGGSWGSTLALAYAETHPERVESLILRGIFLVRRAELEWFYQQGCSWIYPEAFAAYEERHPAGRARRHDRRLSQAAHRSRPARALEGRQGVERVGGLDLVAAAGRRAYPQLRRRRLCASPLRASRRTTSSTPASLPATASCSPMPGRLRDIPGTIVHGRYDVVTPVKNAWDLKAAWPTADLRIVADAGHAMSEPGIAHELVSATRRYRRGAAGA